MSDKVIVRPCREQDKGIILSTWLKGNYFGQQYFKSMDQDLYFKEYSKFIQHLLNHPRSRIDCAVLEDDQDTVLGYIIYNDQTLHWAYTKRDYRKKGILNALMKDMDFEYYSGNTPVGLAIGKKKQLIYNPIGDL